MLRKKDFDAEHLITWNGILIKWSGICVWKHSVAHGDCDNILNNDTSENWV